MVCDRCGDNLRYERFAGLCIGCKKNEATNWTLDILSMRRVSRMELVQMVQPLSKAGLLTSGQYDTIFDTFNDWATAVHEAGHAVINIRNGGVVQKVVVHREVYADDEGTTLLPSGCSYPYANPIKREAYDDALVAGYFCERRWGSTDCPKPSAADIALLSKGRDSATVCKARSDAMRRLSSLVRRNPTFEMQVKAVALALCRVSGHEGDKVLRGDEVVAIMKQIEQASLKARAATA
jgi:hypothetical protein